MSVIDAGHPPLAQSAWLQNNGKMASSNILYKTQNNIQWRVNVAYVNDVQKNQSFNITNIFLPGQFVKVTEQVQNKYVINSIHGVLAVEKNEKNMLLKDQISFTHRWNDNRASDIRDDTTNILQANNENLTFLSNEFNLTTKLGRQLLGISSVMSYRRMPESLVVSPGQFASVLNNGNAYQQDRQDVHFTGFSSDNSLNFINR